MGTIAYVRGSVRESFLQEFLGFIVARQDQFSRGGKLSYTKLLYKSLSVKLVLEFGERVLHN
jgi:hypothetical protein